MKIVGVAYIAMGIGALGLASYLFLTPGALTSFNPNIRIILGIVALVYGAWRLFSGIRTFRKPNTSSLQQHKVFDDKMVG